MIHWTKYGIFAHPANIRKRCVFLLKHCEQVSAWDRSCDSRVIVIRSDYLFARKTAHLLF
jgi:hypothetical protein